jgi:putative transposase
MMALVLRHASLLGIVAVCAAIGMSRATFYRWLRPVYGPPRPRRSQRALSPSERQRVLDVLHEPRFVDKAPGEIYATLLDEGTYLCSERTMYRVLAANNEVRERRDQLRHPAYAAPELLTTRPNELWSWDITKLLGPAKWTYFQLYVILDVFSRMVVGWIVAHRESAHLAEKLIRETCERQGVAPGTLTVHADRGTSMTSKTVALLLSDLGVTKTHSRPHVSNDNPYSESHFKTMKYRPDFPERFGCIQDAREHFARFFAWYNDEHRHGGIGLLTPSDVHYGRAPARIEARANTLAAAFATHP